MGSPKALLEAPGGGSFVVRIARAFADSGVQDVVIVTGGEHTAIKKAVEDAAMSSRVRVVRNPNPSRGQLSSLWVGMDAAVEPETAGLLVTLVDVPLLNPTTITSVIGAWRNTGAPIVRPAIGERHGHPVLFDRVLFEELRAAPLEAGAKTVVRAHEAAIVNVAVDDEGCLVDVDTPEEYERLKQR